MLAPFRSFTAAAAMVFLTALPCRVDAASTAVLPAWVCNEPDAIFVSRFEAGESIPSSPTAGSGGIFPGDVTRSVFVSSIGQTRTYYLHIPANYNATKAWPIVLALHGSSGSAAQAPLDAQQVRSDWSAWADSRGFIVVAPVGTQAQGGWSPSTDVPAIEAALNDAKALYNVEQDRIYLWGFSAGAHLAHSLGLNNTDYFAAYGVSAGALQQFACTDDGSYPPSCNALLGGDTRKIPVDIHLGNDDPLNLPQYGDAGNDPNRFTNNGWLAYQNMYYTVFGGGHEYTAPQLGDIWQNLCPNAVVP